ncbi:MAG TPA: DUF2914 domain-containing protein [Candidatus Paceibacterota bacterium]|nr:DUF2914 domain-containing protein [Candidatus Paceibacterota bacterium]
MAVWEKTKDIYKKYENRLSSVSLIVGFLFDIFVLTRIDMPKENLWIISHLVVAVIGIIIINFYENNDVKRGEVGSVHYWLTVTVQFAFGGLLSTFLVFYFRSATIYASWPFLLLLALSFACNELLKEHYSRLTFQISYFFLCTFLFTIYYVPILFGSFGTETFIFSGFVSLGATMILIFFLFHVTMEKFKKSARATFYSVCGLYVVFNLLYFLNIIPPIPLSLKDAGVFHSISRNNQGNYSVQYEWKNLRDYFRPYESFNYAPGETVYVYSAVFSPTNLNTDILHEWQYYDEDAKEWITATKISLSLVGGREGGYRTYSMTRNIFPGYWRVNVETPSGQVIGRIRFIAREITSTPFLYVGTK